MNQTKRKKINDNKSKKHLTESSRLNEMKQYCTEGHCMANRSFKDVHDSCSHQQHRPLTKAAQRDMVSRGSAALSSSKLHFKSHTSVKCKNPLWVMRSAVTSSLRRVLGLIVLASQGLAEPHRHHNHHSKPFGSYSMLPTCQVKLFKETHKLSGIFALDPFLVCPITQCDIPHLKSNAVEVANTS